MHLISEGVWGLLFYQAVMRIAGECCGWCAGHFMASERRMRLSIWRAELPEWGQTQCISGGASSGKDRPEWGCRAVWVGLLNVRRTRVSSGRDELRWARQERGQEGSRGELRQLRNQVSRDWIEDESTFACKMLLVPLFGSQVRAPDRGERDTVARLGVCDPVT